MEEFRKNRREGSTAKWLRSLIALLVGLFLFIGLIFFIYKAWFDRKKRLMQGRHLEFYEQYLSILRAKGVRKPRHFTPQEFGEEVARLYPELRMKLHRFTEIYYRCRYTRRPPSKNHLEEIDALMEALKKQSHIKRRAA